MGGVTELRVVLTVPDFEQALAFYLHNVVPSQHLVRPQVMDAFEQSVSRNRDLLQRLAK